MAGRPRKPTILKLVAGTQKIGRVNEHEPDPEKGRTPPPEHLTASQKRAWRYLAKMLDAMGVLTKADAAGLERLAKIYAEMRDAEESFARPVTYEKTWTDKESGEVMSETRIVAEGGQATYLTFGQTGPMLRTRPEISQIADADRRFRTYLNDYGLTPASRSKVSVSPTKRKDKAASYFQ